VRNDGYSYRCTVGPEGAGMTLVRYLAGRFPRADEALWRLRVESGEVRVEGVSTEALLQSGRVVVWNRPPWDEPDVPLHFEVLHEDAQVLAVAKPAGLPVLPCAGLFVQSTLLALVRRDRPGARPAHRIDRGTSGVVLFALDAESARTLQRSWDSVGILRTYRALAAGHPVEDEFDMRVPIGRGPHGIHEAAQTGRPAHTRVRVLERRREPCLVEAELRTGRPHQVRIHLAAAGHPVAGDGLYAPGGRAVPGAAHPSDPGGWLHALRLTFPHPATGRPLDVRARPPEPLRVPGE